MRRSAHLAVINHIPLVSGEEVIRLRERKHELSFWLLYFVLEEDKIE